MKTNIYEQPFVTFKFVSIKMISIKKKKKIVKKFEFKKIRQLNNFELIKDFSRIKQ